MGQAAYLPHPVRRHGRALRPGLNRSRAATASEGGLIAPDTSFCCRRFAPGGRRPNRVPDHAPRQEPTRPHRVVPSQFTGPQPGGLRRHTQAPSPLAGPFHTHRSRNQFDGAALVPSQSISCGQLGGPLCILGPVCVRRGLFCAQTQKRGPGARRPRDTPLHGRRPGQWSGATDFSALSAELFRRCRRRSISSDPAGVPSPRAADCVARKSPAEAGQSPSSVPSNHHSYHRRRTVSVGYSDAGPASRSCGKKGPAVCLERGQGLA